MQDALAVFVTICIASFAPIGSLAAIFDVTTYGAVGDGKQDDTQAFLKAWKDACSATNESPTLKIPAAKTFLISPVNFQGPCSFSNVHVQVLGNVVAPNSVDAWKGCVKNSWIVFSSVKNLIVDGSSQIDGQGSFWWRQGHQTPTCGTRPTGGTAYARYISFKNITLNEVQNPIIINQHYCINNTIGDVGLDRNCPEQSKAVQVSNVTYRYVQGSSASKVAINLDCSTNVGCTNITLEHVHINGGLSASCTNAQGTSSDTLPEINMGGDIGIPNILDNIHTFIWSFAIE
ncbi:hypothetical protein LguiB_027629 [Lonicera macranthoides]